MNKISEKILYEGNWLRFKEATYVNDRQQEFKWESIERIRENLAVVIIAKLKPSDRIILIKQYRHTIDGYVIGFPAGLIKDNINDNDYLNREIIKELKEESGYLGKIVEIGPILKSNSGVMNSNSIVVQMEVDEKDPRNLEPKQELETSEKIEVILLERHQIKDFMLNEKNKGSAIGAGLWYLFGLNV